MELSYMDASASARRGYSSISTIGCVPAIQRDLAEEYAAEDDDPGSGADLHQLSVYLRVRPVLTDDDQSQGNPVKVASDTHVIMHAPTTSMTYKSAQTTSAGRVIHRFGFTRVFDSTAGQSAVFGEVMVGRIRQLVRGHSCLMFSYGTTNSGKTYSIYGPPRHVASDPGILPRALDTLFNTVSGRLYRRLDIQPVGFGDVCRVSPQREQDAFNVKFAVMRHARQHETLGGGVASAGASDGGGSVVASDDMFKSLESLVDLRPTDLENRVRETTKISLQDQPSTRFSVWMSVVEIYNEYIYDLLVPIDSTTQRRKQLSLGLDKNGDPYLKDVRQVEVRSADEACLLIRSGQRQLRFAATKLNENSSRSHCVVTVRVIRLLEGPAAASATAAAAGRAANEAADHRMTRCSMLTVCDLAGTERVEKSHTQGARMKETANINKSLMVLGRCLKALRQQQSRSCVAGGGQVGGPLSLPTTCQPTSAHAAAASSATSSGAHIVVPYRDSKLTRLFQPFFTGGGGGGVSASTQVSLLVNIGPDARVFDETIHTLKFSALARQVCVHVEPKERERSRFSVMARQSLRPGTLARPIMSSTVLQDQPDAADQQRQALTEMVETLTNQLAEARRDNVTQETRLRQQLGDEFAKQLEDVEKFWRNCLNEGDMNSQKAADQQYRFFSAQAQRTDTELEEYRERAEVAEERNCRLEMQLQSLGDQQQLASQQLQQRQQLCEQLQQQLDDASTQVTSLRAQLSEAEARHSEHLLSSNNEAIAQLNDELSKYKEAAKLQDIDIREANEMIREGGKELVTLEDQNEELCGRAEQLQTQVDRLKQELQDKQGQMADLERICQGSSERIIELEQQVAEMQTVADIGHVVRRLSVAQLTDPAAVSASPQHNTQQQQPSGDDRNEGLMTDDLDSTAVFEQTEQRLIDNERSNQLLQEAHEQLCVERGRCAQLDSQLSAARQLLAERCEQLATAANEQLQLQAELKRLLRQQHQQVEDSAAGGQRERQLMAECEAMRRQLGDSQAHHHSLDVVLDELRDKKSRLQQAEHQLSELRAQLDQANAAQQRVMGQCDQLNDRVCKLQLRNDQLTAKLAEKVTDMDRMRDNQSELMLNYEQNMRRVNESLTVERNERVRLHEVMGRLTPQPTTTLKGELERVRQLVRQQDETIISLRQQARQATHTVTHTASTDASTNTATIDASHPHNKSPTTAADDFDSDGEAFATPAVHSVKSRKKTARRCTKVSSTKKSSAKRVTRQRKHVAVADKLLSSDTDADCNEMRLHLSCSSSSMKKNKENINNNNNDNNDSAGGDSVSQDGAAGRGNLLTCGDVQCDGSLSNKPAVKSAHKRRLFNRRVSQDTLSFSPAPESGVFAERECPHQIVTRQLRSRKVAK